MSTHLKKRRFTPYVNKLELRELLTSTVIDLDTGAEPRSHSAGHLVNVDYNGNISTPNPAFDSHGSLLADEIERYDPSGWVISVNCTDASGAIRDDLIDLGAHWAISWRNAYLAQPGHEHDGVSVCMPIGSFNYSWYLDDAVNQLRVSDIPTAIAASNYSRNLDVSPVYPANNSGWVWNGYSGSNSTITVSACNSGSGIYDYSDYGYHTVALSVEVPYGGGTSEACAIAASRLAQLDGAITYDWGRQPGRLVVDCMINLATPSNTQTITGKYLRTYLS
jgi:hypothetical protein